MCGISHAETFNQYWYVENNTPIQTTCETGGDITLPAAPTKYGYDFIGWEKSPYIRIEYLESTGTQWIDTGFLFKQSENITLFTQIEFIGNSNRYVICTSLNGLSNLEFALEINSARTRVYINGSNFFGTSITGNTKYEIEFRNTPLKSTFLLDNQTVISYTNTFSDITPSLRLFKDHRSGVFGNVKIYYFQIYDNNILVRDFIPVLDDDGVPCMYDLVEGKFYYNAGTGQFVAGPIIGGE